MMKNKAFTLVETLLAVTLLTVVITAVTGLILNTLLVNERDIRRTQATFYAEEGLEVLRYMRDSNWLQNYSWDGGAWGQDFHVDASTLEKTIYIVQGDCSGTAPCFSLSAKPKDGVITNADGVGFSRALTMAAVLDDSGAPISGQAQVTATVSWNQRGSEQSVQLSTYLTQWQ